MRSPGQKLHHPETSLPQERLRHLILKLRWVGVECGAEELSAELLDCAQSAKLHFCNGLSSPQESGRSSICVQVVPHSHGKLHRRGLTPNSASTQGVKIDFGD